MTNELELDPKTLSIKNFAWWMYILHAISMMVSLGLLSFIPLILNYLKQNEASETFVYSHHRWQIRSFWWYLAWVMLGWILFLTFFGIPLAALIWTLAWIWKAYRLLKGILDLNANKTMPMRNT